MKTKALSLFALTLIVPAARAATLLVAATANPWLAGMPDGTTAIGVPGGCGTIDTAPGQSPKLFAPVVPGSALTFSVSGGVMSGPSELVLQRPDGAADLVQHPAENGIAGFNGPLDSLVGVFLDSSQPSLTPAPTNFPSLPSALTISPGLKQVFFIGDGRTGTRTGALQQFVAPPGATRLFLGTVGGCEWNNNRGAFVGTVEVVRYPLALIRVSEVEVCWPSESNALYRVDYRSEFTTNTWVPLLTNVVAIGQETCVTDKVVRGTPQRFYRVYPTQRD